MPKVKAKVTQEQVQEGWGGGFSPAPIGPYRARTRTVTHGYSKNADGSLDQGRQRLEVVWELTARIDNGQEESLPTRYSNVYDYIAFSEGHAPKMAQFAVAIGKIDPNNKRKTYNIEWDYAELDHQVKAAQGKEAIITLTPDTDLNGNYRPRVGAMLPIDGADSDDLEDDDFEDEAEDEFEAEAEAPDVPSPEDIDALDKQGLVDLLKEAGIKVKKGTKASEVRQMLKDHFATEEGSKDDDDLPF